MDHALTQIVTRFEHGMRALAAHAARWNVLLLIGFSVLYFAATCLLASTRLFWFDELFTFHLAKLDIAEQWAALTGGVDLNPPLSYLLTSACHALFGDSPVATRLPAVVGFWVLLLCLYTFVAQRCGRLCGWLAMLLPLATWAYPYAYEARPYGVVMGCCGVALVCWQRASDGRGRRWAIPVLGLSLAAAVASHYYAVLLFGPLLLGELVRTRIRRRIDGPMLTAFLVGLVPFLVMLPVIRQSASYAATHTEQARWSFVHEFYNELLGRTLLPLVLVLIVACVGLRAARRRDEGGGLLLHELALVLGFLALPVVGTLLAKLGGGAFGLRYVVSAVAGVALLCTATGWRLVRDSALFGGAVIGILLIWFAGIVAGDYQRVRAEAASLRADYEFLAKHGPAETPVVIPGPITYLQFFHYAPADLKPRLLYVMQPRLRDSYFGERRYSVEGALIALHQWKPMNLVTAPEEANPGGAYYVYSPGRLTEQLETTAARLELCGRHGRNLLFFTGDRPRPVPELVRVMPKPTEDSWDDF